MPNENKENLNINSNFKTLNDINDDKSLLISKELNKNNGQNKSHKISSYTNSNYRKEKFANNLRKPSYKSLDIIHKRKKEKEKYFEKYLENGEVTKDLNQYYYNFSNKTALNITDANNSINPGK